MFPTRACRAIFAVAAFAWAAPQVHKSLSGIRKAEYEIATPIDEDIRAARERFQRQLDKDAAEAEKLRKEQEEQKRQERLEELKNGPKSRKELKGRDYSSQIMNSEGMGGGGGRMGRVKPCPPGG